MESRAASSFLAVMTTSERVVPFAGGAVWACAAPAATSTNGADDAKMNFNERRMNNSRLNQSGAEWQSRRGKPMAATPASDWNFSRFDFALGGVTLRVQVLAHVAAI